MGMADLHWHAYSYTGHECPPDSERMRAGTVTPPIEVAHWLRKPADRIEKTFLSPVRAESWLAQQLDESPAPDGAMPPETRIQWARYQLDAQNDVVWGYYTASGRYASRCLIRCPRPGERCPAPPGGSLGHYSAESGR